MKETLRTIFEKQFEPNPNTRFFFSPGRINLIGEHTDYNGGYVFPCALSIGNYGAISLRNDKLIRLYSENLSEFGIITLNLINLNYQSSHGWANYAKGVIKELLLRGYKINQGFDIAILGNLPVSAGLSSSASIELLISTMMNECFHLGISKTDLALLSQKVENEYIHVNCGIMDQFVIANGKEGHALLLDTAKLEYSLVSLDLKDYEIVICNSKVKRGLVDSAYNERRQECEAALIILQQKLDIHFLCNISIQEFNPYRNLFENPILLKRATHVISENSRTLEAYSLLIKHDILGFGKLITQSHQSLRDDFQVSCKELDGLVDLALNEGSLGSRMTGAGFGGCTINIVSKDRVEEFKKNVSRAYVGLFGITPDILISYASDGAKEI
ncbi:MAG: galactokinase [Firmicutes bacterium]|nr:galactokinase [Bacillota bacterium]